MTRGELKEIIKECIEEVELEAADYEIDQEVEENYDYLDSVCEEYGVSEDVIMAEGSCEKFLDEEFFLTESDTEEKDPNFFKSMKEKIIQGCKWLKAKISGLIGDIKSKLNSLTAEAKKKWETVLEKLRGFKERIKEMLGIAKSGSVTTKELHAVQKELKEKEQYVNTTAAAAAKSSAMKHSTTREKRAMKHASRMRHRTAV